MRRLVILLLAICTLSLVGCSNSANYSWNSGVLNGPKGIMELSVFEGYKAEAEFSDLEMKFYICDDIEGCPHNVIGVEKESMTEYKKALYYVGYLNTQMWMFVENDGGGYIECNVQIPRDAVLTTDAIAELVYNKMQTMTLSDDIKSLDINGVVSLNTADWDFKVRPTDVIIPGSVRIKLDDGSITKSGSELMPNGELVDKYVGDKYTYYLYKGLIIQITTGLSLESYVTLK